MLEIIIATLIPCVLGRSIELDAAVDSLEWKSEVLFAGVISVVGIVCFIVLLIGCADICRREAGFKDFENDDVFTTDLNTPPPTSSQFTMYPPVESTPDVISAAPIVFEPLPDPIQLRARASGPAPNTHHLRPKVAISSRDRTESEDSLDDNPPDAMQEKMRLHGLLVNSRNQIPRSQLQYIKELGNGWFGKVLQGEGQKILPGHKKTKVVIQMLREDSDSSEQLAFLQEGVPYRDVDHPNVLRLLGQCVDATPYLTVLELCPFGDVKTYLRSHRIAVESFNEKGLLLKFACDIAAGLQALHQQGFVHRDFATRNCMLASDLSVKIGDYGVSEDNFKEDYYFDPHGDAIPIRWLAPETMHVTDEGTIIVKYITKDSNIWSFGICLWEIIMFGALPYSDLNNDHVIRLVIKERSLKPTKPDMPVSHLERLYQLLALCWADAGSRPSLRELRIMLLHLMSAARANTDADAFEQKWNQLMPRRQPQVAKVAPQQRQVITTQADITPLKSHAKRPMQFEDDFGVSNPSLHGNAGSLDPEDVEIPGLHKSGIHVGPDDSLTPANELSLEAEFSAANFSDSMRGQAGISLSDELSQAEDSKTEAVNVSLAQELAASQAYSPTDSEMGEDIIEIHTSDHANDNGKVNASYEEDEDIEENEANATPVTVSITDESSSADTPVVSQASDNSQVTSPDVAMSSTPKTGAATPPSSEDFLTSTPKRGGDYQDSKLVSPSDQSSSYHTAFMSQMSTDDEPSILGQRKFAACLQTVVTSFDGEDLEGSGSFNDNSLDEDVFRIPHTIPEEHESESNAEKTKDDTLTDIAEQGAGEAAAPEKEEISLVDTPQEQVANESSEFASVLSET